MCGNILLQEDQMSKAVKDLQEIAPICLCISICLTYCAAAILQHSSSAPRRSAAIFNKAS